MTRTIVTTLVITSIAGSLAIAQRSATPQSAARDMTITVDSTVPFAKDQLAHAKISQSGPMPFAAHPDGDKWLYYSLEPGKADLVLQYSPRRNRLTDLTVYFLGQPRSKTSDIAMRISSITLHPDGSYSLRFPRSRTTDSPT